MTLERERTEPRKERISQPVFDNMLSFVGNHEAKAILFRAMVPVY